MAKRVKFKYNSWAKNNSPQFSMKNNSAEM